MAAPTKRSEYAASVARCADGVGTRTFVKLLADSPLPAYASTLRDAEARVHTLVGTISARLDADELDRALADRRVLRVEASCVARTNPADVSGRCSGDATDVTIVDRLVIPPETAAGAYVLGWRWDAEETAQVWSSCADVFIDVAPPPSPSGAVPGGQPSGNA